MSQYLNILESLRHDPDMRALPMSRVQVLYMMAEATQDKETMMLCTALITLKHEEEQKALNQERMELMWSLLTEEQREEFVRMNFPQN